eukprot:CAMPEP_0174721716 /NCGR_PEP_ID=MMETSP1094-20130205/36973_1 /TAXON_ID=156173 /ORGANISM="Chrysochromulina brevifilum, Strain UTEX LB 985" /LENGTH=188 /DNA_ID=CAMNT_0015922461 /DNA_START=88 /DNA_END=655 /DNA_ORIENTATION=+
MLIVCVTQSCAWVARFKADRSLRSSFTATSVPVPTFDFVPSRSDIQEEQNEATKNSLIELGLVRTLRLTPRKRTIEIDNVSWQDMGLVRHVTVSISQAPRFLKVPVEQQTSTAALPDLGAAVSLVMAPKKANRRNPRPMEHVSKPLLQEPLLALSADTACDQRRMHMQVHTVCPNAARPACPEKVTKV